MALETTYRDMSPSIASDCPRRWAVWAAGAVIVLAGIAAYVNSFQGLAVFDDLSMLGETHDLLQGDHSRLASRTVATLTFAANMYLHEDRVWGYHLVNLCVHLLAALTLMGIVRRTLLTDRLRPTFGPYALWLAAASALLWAVHPLNTQAVTYIVQRCESLMGLLYLLTLYCFIRGATGKRHIGWYVAAVIACFLGMGSKENMIVILLTVPAYDRIFLSDSFKSLLRRRWGVYLGMVLSVCMLADFFIRQWSSIPREVHTDVPGGVPTMLSPLDYALSQFGVIVHYLQLAFWPSGLCLDYWWPKAPWPGGVLPYAAVVAALLGLTVYALIRRPAWGFLGLWFFLILAPTSSVVPVVDLAFEHRMYLPLAAVVVLAVILVFLAGRGLIIRFNIFAVNRRRWGTIAGVVATLALAAAMGYRTRLRNMDYHSQVAIWQSVVDQRPENPRGHNNLANNLRNAGNLWGAIEHYNKTLELKPDYVETYNNRGCTYGMLNKHRWAMNDFNKALAMNPNYGNAYYNRAIEFFYLRDYDRAWEDVNACRRFGGLPPDPELLKRLMAVTGRQE